jgi:hypothetical protein
MPHVSPQARNAREVYCERFRGIALDPRPESPEPHDPPSRARHARPGLAAKASRVTAPRSTGQAPTEQDAQRYGTRETPVKVIRLNAVMRQSRGGV